MRFPLNNLILVLTLVLLASCNSPVSTRTTTDIKDSVSSQRVAPSENKKLSDSALKVLRFQKMKNLKAVEEIVRSSPDFKKVTSGLKEAVLKNGGLGWKLDFNEDEPDTIDYLYTYTFSIYEIYDDRTPRVETYCFNLNENQLYKEQFIDTDSLPAGSLIPVSFNKKLLKLIIPSNESK